MGTKRLRSEISRENVHTFSVPPGFASLTSFKLKRVGGSEQTLNSVGDVNSYNEEKHQISNMLELENLKRPCRHRPWILDDQIKHEQEDSVSDQVDTVKAKWLPRDAIRDLGEAPVFYPTEEEFREFLKYISTVSQIASAYGMCRIVPPPSWSPPSISKETSPFVAQVQWIGGLQKQYLQIGMTEIHENGCKDRNSCQVDAEHRFDTLETFKKYSDDFKCWYFRKRSKMAGSDSNVCLEQPEPSREDIEAEYMRMLQNCSEKIKVLYCDNLKSEMAIGFPPKAKSQNRSNCHCWNLYNTPMLSTSLLSFENSRTSESLVPRLKIGMCFSSSFWKVEEHHLYSLCYMHLGAPKIWYGIPGACRDKFEAFLEKHLPNQSTLQPELRDRLIASLMSSMLKSEDFPVYRCVQQPREFVLFFPGAYYSGFDAGFNCVEAVNVAPLDWLPYGQNVVEIYSKQHRKTAISHDKLLLGATREAVRALWEISLLKKDSVDNLRWKGACGKDGILTKAFKSRVELEAARQEYLCTASQARKMDVYFDATEKRECSICFYDLHLSAAWCPCSVDRYSCLSHAKQLCSCPWSKRIFLFRYTINELNSLVEALEGKFRAVYFCAKDILKLSLRATVENNLGGRVSPRRGSEEAECKSGHPATSLVNGSSTGKNTGEKMKARLQARSTNQKHKHISELYKLSQETKQSTKLKEETKNATSHKRGTTKSAKPKQTRNASVSFLAEANFLACAADSSSESSSTSSSS